MAGTTPEIYRIALIVVKSDDFSARSEISSRFAGRWIWFCSWGTRALYLALGTQGAMADENRTRCQVPENRWRLGRISCTPEAISPSP